MTQKNILILDDDAHRRASFGLSLLPHQVDQANTADSCIQLLRTMGSTPYNYIFLDHDLEMSGPNCGDGREVVKFLVNNHPVCSALIHAQTKIIVHSLNSTFSPDMVRELERGGFLVCRRAYAWHDREDLRAINDDAWPMNLERWVCREPMDRACVYGLERRAQLVNQQGTLTWE